LGPDAILDEKEKRIRDERIKLFNAIEDDASAEGFIKIRPKVDGRLVNIREE